MACSFQKEESVLIDLLMRIEPSARVFTIDTGVLFPETYEVWRQVEDRYGLAIEVMDAAPPNGTPWSAGELLRRPQGRGARAGALVGVDAWITGIRREQSPTRANAEAVEWDSCARGMEVQSARGVDRRRRLALCRTTTICPTIRCTTGGTNPSDALPARCPATAARAVGRGRRRPSAVFTHERHPLSQRL